MDLKLPLMRIILSHQPKKLDQGSVSSTYLPQIGNFYHFYPISPLVFVAEQNRGQFRTIWGWFNLFLAFLEKQIFRWSGRGHPTLSYSAIENQQQVFALKTLSGTITQIDLHI